MNNKKEEATAFSFVIERAFSYHMCLLCWWEIMPPINQRTGCSTWIAVVVKCSPSGRGSAHTGSEPVACSMLECTLPWSDDLLRQNHDLMFTVIVCRLWPEQTAWSVLDMIAVTEIPTGLIEGHMRTCYIYKFFFS